MFNWFYIDISLFLVCISLVVCGFYMVDTRPHWTLMALSLSSALIIIVIASEVMRVIYE